MRKPLGKLGRTIAALLLHAGTFLLLFSSTLCHAQDNCAYNVPSLSTITSITWTAGQTTTVTIDGANFCPDYGFVTSTDDNGDFPITSYTYNGTSQIVLTVSPAASDPPATISVTVGDCDDDCGYAVSFNVQIVNKCTPPTISSITPLGWWAGQDNQSININGSCFLMPSDKGGPSKVSVTANGVTLSNVHVVDPTWITATVNITKKAPAETVTLTVTNPPASGVSGTVTANPAPVVLPIPVIKWKTREISGDNAKTQKVQVGQPVELTTTPDTLPGGFTISQSTWTIPGTNVQQFSHPNSGIVLTPTETDQPKTAYYWLYPKDAMNVVYTYCATDPNGNQICESPEAKAVFNAESPGALSLDTDDSLLALVQKLEGCPNGTGKYLDTEIFPGRPRAAAMPKATLASTSQRQAPPPAPTFSFRL